MHLKALIAECAANAIACGAYGMVAQIAAYSDAVAALR